MYKCTYVYVRFVIGLLLLWSWLIKRSWLDLGFLRFWRSLFLRLWPASMLICVICCLQTCMLKNPSHSFNCLIFMQQEPLFVHPHLTILLIKNRLVLQEVLWFASPGTGGVALRLLPSAHTCTAAPPVLVCIVQRLVQLRGLSIPRRTEKGVLRPLQLQVPPWEASLAALRVFSLFR